LKSRRIGLVSRCESSKRRRISGHRGRYRAAGQETATGIRDSESNLRSFNLTTIKSSKSKADVEANADAIKSALATDLFGGKVEAAQITLAVADARRRLLAGSTITATVTTDATTFAALTTAYKTNAAAFQTKYASTYGVTSLASNDVAAAKVALAVVAALAVMAA